MRPGCSVGPARVGDCQGWCCCCCCWRSVLTGQTCGVGVSSPGPECIREACQCPAWSQALLRQVKIMAQHNFTKGSLLQP